MVGGALGLKKNCSVKLTVNRFDWETIETHSENLSRDGPSTMGYASAGSVRREGVAAITSRPDFNIAVAMGPKCRKCRFSLRR